MRIAMIGHKTIPSRLGGVEVVVQQLSAGLVKAGHEVTAFNRATQESNDKKIYKGIKLKTVPTLKIKGFSAVTSSLFATVMASLGNYDVIHIHAEGPAVMSWIPKLFGKKCVVTIHGLDYKRDKWGRFAKKYIKLGEKIAVRYADQIIVLNKPMQDYFRQRYNRKTVLIPNGIKEAHFVEENKIHSWGLKKDSYILFLGRIVPEKGIESLIKAFKKVKTDKELVIAGGSSDTDEFFTKMKKLSFDDNRIKFVGFVSGRILNELYTNAYAYILPSKLEGMPIGLLEAISYGKCCIVSNIPENLDIIGNAGIVFEKGNIKDMTNKLNEIFAHPELTLQMGLAAKKKASTKYNWSTIVQKTLKVYEGKND